VKRDLSAAIIISLVLHAALVGALHVAVLSAGRDADFANAGEGAIARGTKAPIRVVMSERRTPDGPARADGTGRVDRMGVRGDVGDDGGVGVDGGAGDADRAAGEASRSAPAAVDHQPDTRANAEASAANADASTESPAGRDTSAEAAGESTSDDLAPAGEPAHDLAAHNAVSVEDPSPPEARVARPPRLATPIEPEYPFRARRLGHEGTVAFTVLVGAGGAVLDITLDESSGHAELDRAARAAVSHASYVSGSSRAPMPLRVRVVFEIEDGVFN
jgi:TonB family protein